MYYSDILTLCFRQNELLRTQEAVTLYRVFDCYLLLAQTSLQKVVHCHEGDYFFFHYSVIKILRANVEVH